MQGHARWLSHLWGDIGRDEGRKLLLVHVALLLAPLVPRRYHIPQAKHLYTSRSRKSREGVSNKVVQEAATAIWYKKPPQPSLYPRPHGHTCLLTAFGWSWLLILALSFSPTCQKKRARGSVDGMLRCSEGWQPKGRPVPSPSRVLPSGTLRALRPRPETPAPVNVHEVTGEVSRSEASDETITCSG